MNRFLHYKKFKLVWINSHSPGGEDGPWDAALFGATLDMRGKKKKNSCEKWCPKFKATSVRIHFSAWWIIEQQPEQPWSFALFLFFFWNDFCMNKMLFGLQNCLLRGDTTPCSNTEIVLGIVLFFLCSLPPRTFRSARLCLPLCLSASFSLSLSLSIWNSSVLPCLALAVRPFPLITLLLYLLSTFQPEGPLWKAGNESASSWRASCKN